LTTRAIALLSALALLAAAPPAGAKEKRDPHQRALFVKSHPCPATGKNKGACPGYVVDHIKPLCAGGADHPSNMQWQTREEAKIKDRRETEQCRRFRSQHYRR
jgi:hypothetical protein